MRLKKLELFNDRKHLKHLKYLKDIGAICYKSSGVNSPNKAQVIVDAPPKWKGKKWYILSLFLENL
jgi:hypothetical protein